MEMRRRLLNDCQRSVSCLMLVLQWVVALLSPRILQEYVGGADGVTLRPFGNEQKLVSTKYFRKNEVILTVPASICLFSHRSGAVRGLSGQTDLMWYECGDLRSPLEDAQITAGRTWDVQLALALLDATVGTGLGGEFWDEYASALPRPECLTIPFCIKSETVLSLLQSSDLRDAAIKQQQRLMNISPTLLECNYHRVTAEALNRMGGDDVDSAVPGPLQWAFAMVRSRCFRAAEDWFAVVPVIDMANHDNDPCGRFEASEDMSAFCIRALRDVSAGEEITISYGEGYSNDRLFTQYGFVIEGNPNNAIAWPQISSSSSSSSTAAAATAAATGSGSETEPVSAAVTVLKERVFDYLIEAATKVLLESGDSSLSDHIPTVSRSLRSRVITLLGALDPAVAATVNTEQVFSRLTGELSSICETYPTSLDEDIAILAKIREPPSKEEEREAGGYLVISGEILGIQGSSEKLNRYQCEAALVRRVEIKQTLVCAQRILETAVGMLLDPNFTPEK